MNPNAEQEVIIKYFTNPNISKRILLVEAPPGTGKTFTAVSAAINYTHYNLKNNPNYNKKALLLTFSKNARAQIEKQLDELDDGKINSKKYIEITNFHSFFQKYVWAYSKYLGLKEEMQVLSTKQRRNRFKAELSSINDYMDDDDQFEWVDSLLEGEFYPLTTKGNIKPSVKRLIPHKEKIKEIIKKVNKEGFIGFSDMGYYMKELLDKSPALLEIIQSKYNFIILDEYQDSSDLQNKIVTTLIGKKNKAIFFADSKQMIYGWRGASHDRLSELFKFYNGEIEKKELITNMRFKGRTDIEYMLNDTRQGTHNINNFDSSDNIKYIKVKVNDKNLFSQQSKNYMYSALKYKIKNTLPKYEDRKGKSIGIQCKKNEQVNYIKKALREEFSIIAQTICNNDEEYNVICDLIDFLKTDVKSIDKDMLSREILKYVFEVIYDDNIGSIRRNKIDDMGFANLKNARLKFLKSLAMIVEEASIKGNYAECVVNSINLVCDFEFRLNYEMLSLLKKMLYQSRNSYEKITDLFLQYQFQKSFKELRGIYVLNVHQSKGREFDEVYLVDRENINKDENLLYVALSRVKQKLVIFDWVI